MLPRHCNSGTAVGCPPSVRVRKRSHGQRALNLRSTAELNNSAPVAFARPPFWHRRVLLHRLSLFGKCGARGFARLGFAIQRLRYRRGASHLAELQDLDLKLAALIPDMKHVFHAHFPCRLCFHAIRANTPQIARMRCQCPRLEKTRCPKPFIDAHAVHEC